MVLGFAGKILRVDLTSGSISTDEPDEKFYRTYLGGAGFVSYFLLNEIPRGVDAFSPENKIVWGIGPMTGLPMPGNSRSCVGTKSPLTDGFSKSEAGGHWPAALKRAGYDAVIVEGRSEKPVYLLVTEEKVELRDASHLWGKTTLETQDTIAEETGIENIRLSCIGPAGENMVRFACIINDLKEAHGRGGTGAVMGSKNLKAIAAYGRRRPEVADPEKIQEMARWMGRNFRDFGFAESLSKQGTGEHSMMLSGNEIGNMPSYNFDVNSFDGTAKITANTTLDTYGVGMDGCDACGVRCKKVVEIGEPWNVDPRNGGPEYESLASLGAICGVDDLAAVCKANELANLYSMDTISLGVAVGFGMECFEKELLSSEDTNGVDLRFGNGEALVQAVEMIARREGRAGDILAEGVKKAAERIGKGADEFAVHVKGVEVPMHDPRVKQGLGLVYAVEAHGADHCAGMHDLMYTEESPMMNQLLGVGARNRPMATDDLGMDKVVTEKAAHVAALFRDSVVVCQFLPWTVSQHTEIVRAATGWAYTVHEAVQLGERIATLGRIFNLREGLTTADDTLPKRMFRPTQRGALRDGGVDPAKMQEAITMFYGVMGWDEQTGIPTRAKLGELDIGWAAEHIPS